MPWLFYSHHKIASAVLRIPMRAAAQYLCRVLMVEDLIRCVIIPE